VAGVPPRSSYVWGGRTAPITAAVAWAATVVRLISPLQWVKAIYRGSAARRGANLRRDIPPAMTDVYFLVVLAIAVGGLVMARINLMPDSPIANAIIDFIAWILLVESIGWVLYYFLVRRLVEANFVIFHPAEYLLLFPVQVAIQSCLIAILTAATWADVALIFVGQGSPAGALQVFAAFLAAAYLGILIATLLSSLPALRFRPPHLWYVIGGGEVSQSKLVPALEVLGVRRSEIVIFDSDERVVADWLARGYRTELALGGTSGGRRRPVDPVTWVRRSPGICVIATPTDDHVSLIKRLEPTGVHCVVEKPLTLSRTELASLKARPELLDAAFTLSYYSLEKALPVTYLFDSRPVLGERLRIESRLGESEEQITDRLGSLSSVDICLLEGLERSPRGLARAWTESSGSLADLGETALHPLMVAGHVLPLECRDLAWKDIRVGHFGPRRNELASAGRAMSPSFLSAVALSPCGASLRIRVGKYIHPTQLLRGGIAQFEGGTVVFDFDAESCTVLLGDGEVAWTASTLEPTAKYTTQMGLALDWIHSARSPRAFDDLATQYWALDEWFRLVDASTRMANEFEYDGPIPEMIIGALPRVVD
jgi:hypothetical protein